MTKTALTYKLEVHAWVVVVAFGFFIEEHGWLGVAYIAGGLIGGAGLAWIHDWHQHRGQAKTTAQPNVPAPPPRTRPNPMPIEPPPGFAIPERTPRRWWWQRNHVG